MSNIQCRVCEKQFGAQFFAKHIKSHNLEYVDYVKQHMEDFLQCGWKWCDNCGIEPARIFPSSKKKWATCSRKCMMKYRSKKWREENSHPFLGKQHTDETKKKCSISQKNKLERDGHPFLGKHLTEEHKKKVSRGQKKHAQQPDYKNPMAGKAHKPESIAKICKDRVGSSLELMVKKELENAGYIFTHQFFIVDDGRAYSFDFKLKGLPIVIEADGDYWHGGPGVEKHFIEVERIKETDKIKEQVVSQRGYKLVRVWESEMKQNPRVLIERIKHVL